MTAPADPYRGAPAGGRHAVRLHQARTGGLPSGWRGWWRTRRV